MKRVNGQIADGQSCWRRVIHRASLSPLWPRSRIASTACLEPLGLTVTGGAEILGVARHTLSRVINGQARISPDMAIRLEKAFGGSADSWVRMQAAYDLARARQHENRIDVDRYVTA